MRIWEISFSDGGNEDRTAKTPGRFWACPELREGFPGAQNHREGFHRGGDSTCSISHKTLVREMGKKSIQRVWKALHTLLNCIRGALHNYDSARRVTDSLSVSQNHRGWNGTSGDRVQPRAKAPSLQQVAQKSIQTGLEFIFREGGSDWLSLKRPKDVGSALNARQQVTPHTRAAADCWGRAGAPRCAGGGTVPMAVPGPRLAAAARRMERASHGGGGRGLGLGPGRGWASRPAPPPWGGGSCPDALRGTGSAPHGSRYLYVESVVWLCVVDGMASKQDGAVGASGSALPCGWVPSLLELSSKPRDYWEEHLLSVLKSPSANFFCCS